MQFRQGDLYPSCENYLQYFLRPDILKKQHQRVWDAFREVCGSEQWATAGLIYGKGPLVYIGCVPSGKQGKYWAKGKTVFIHPLVALLYEKHTHPQQKYWDRMKVELSLLDWMPWEATVLHEIVHWARDMGQKPEDYNGEEAGHAFEIKAYDRKIVAGATKGHASQCEYEPRPPWE